MVIIDRFFIIGYYIGSTFIEENILNSQDSNVLLLLTIFGSLGLSFVSMFLGFAYAASIGFPKRQPNGSEKKIFGGLLLLALVLSVLSLGAGLTLDYRLGRLG